MAIDTRNLTGARASSAVRCIAKAEHEALGTPREDNLPGYLDKAFKRGVNVGRAWASGLAGATGSKVELEAEIPWGLGWVGHADALDMDDHIVYEAYHAAGGAFREEKALQAAFYADELGPDWTAELAVIDTTDVSDEDGFAVQPYEINVDGLRERVRDIKRRVIAAVEAGAVNPEDRVSDPSTGPRHSECRSCPFAQACWQGWQPPHPSEIVGIETTVDALRVTESDYHHASAALDRIKERRDQLRDELRPYTQPGIPLDAGTGVLVKRIEVAGRTSVQLSAFEKAGFPIPQEMEPFVKRGNPSERWTISDAK